MSREIDPYRIPKARWEVAPVAGLAAIDINANGGAWSGREFIGESTLGGVAVYAIYQALLTALRTEALRKRGATDRLLALNAERYAEEVAQGLHSKGGSKASGAATADGKRRGRPPKAADSADTEQIGLAL